MKDWASHGTRGVVMVNGGGLAVHQLFRMDDAPAKGLTDTLMPETHTKKRDLSGKLLNRRNRYSASFGVQGPATPRCAAGLSAAICATLISSLRRHHHVRPQLGEILHQVVGEES